jgi:branched-chain amino acid aminotransferase|tara:strand:+ start:10210 stop:11253 length:1044 start_codon:yes stop_codon:yes gene_type:complete
MNIRITEKSNLSKIDFNNLGFGAGLSDHVFICEYKNGSWGEGSIEPYRSLSQGLGLHALHYGQAVFEGQKAYRQKDNSIAIFRPERNLKRLNVSAQRMLIPEVPKNIFMEGLIELIKVDSEWVPKGENQSLYLRPFLFSSSEFVAARPSEEYTFAIVTSPVGELYSKPVKVKIEQSFTRAASGGVGYAKAAGNYGGSFLATHNAVKEGFNQVLWTDHAEHNYLEEAGTMNVAFVLNNKLITPILSDRILAGITRDSILTLAKEWNIPIEERRIKVDELIAALKDGSLNEAFGMGTAAVVSQINGIGFNDLIFPVPVPENGIAMRMKKALSSIRYGESEDKYNWMYHI